MENTAYEADECEEVGSNPPGAEQDSFVPERMHDIVGEWTVKEDHRINNMLRKENCSRLTWCPCNCICTDQSLQAKQ